MSERMLEELRQFHDVKDLKESWYQGIEFMDEAVIRDPPSKHQEKVRELQNKIKWLYYQYNQAIRKDEGGEE